MNNDEMLKIIEGYCSKLMEHFDSVQIFATKYEGEKEVTRNIANGKGNWFSRIGQITDWLNKEKACSIESVIEDYDDDEII